MGAIGVVARADQGGLASQTLEMTRHVAASRVLIVDLGDRGRGPSRPERFDAPQREVRVTNGAPKPKHLEWLLEGVDVVYTAEVTYGPLLPVMASHMGVKLVVHANPELWVEHEYRGPTTHVFTPTEWCADRVPRSSVMPMPVNREVLPFRLRTQAQTFWHPAAPAMLDRHGSNLVRAALGHVARPMRLIVTGDDDCRFAHGERIGLVQIERRDGLRANYWDGYDEPDVMLLPRRYGGLSLPTQEALSAGMPVVMLDTGPYVNKGGVVGVPVTSGPLHWMKGGEFPVHDSDPSFLAEAINTLMGDESMVRTLSWEAHAHAAALCWTEWAPAWQAVLSR